MSPLVITIAVLIFMIVAFLSGKMAYSLVSFIAILILGFTGVLKPSESFGYLANTNLDGKYDGSQCRHRENGTVADVC